MGQSLVHRPAPNPAPFILAWPKIRSSSGTRQKGVILFFTLIALVVMSLAAIALVRSVDTSISISGNAAFKQATVQTGDAGIEIAAAALPGIVLASAEQNIANQYFALEQPVDATGLPTTINWGTVPCRDTAGTVVSCGDNSLYRIQYVIDRLCGGTLPVTNILENCVAKNPLDDGSKKNNAPQFTTSTKVYYRATVRVQGPRNATSIIQGTLGL
ncbi:MAG: pilus assembly protein PilX [Pseudomonadota bacterium]